jgi:uncharacterized protein (TIGR02466 family)
MQIERYPLFVQSVYRASYEHAEQLKETIIPLFKEFESNNPLDNKEYTSGSYTSYSKTPDVFDTFNNELSDLKNWICQKVHEIHQGNNIDYPISMKGSWFSINRKYSYHEQHNHIPHVWSGVYYVQSDFDKDAKITFCSPNNLIRWPYRSLASYNEETSLETTMHSSTGSMWIFPSFLEHKVLQHMSDNERVSIAFNFDYIT